MQNDPRLCAETAVCFRQTWKTNTKFSSVCTSSFIPCHALVNSFVSMVLQLGDVETIEDLDIATVRARIQARFNRFAILFPSYFGRRKSFSNTSKVVRRGAAFYEVINISRGTYDFYRSWTLKESN